MNAIPPLFNRIMGKASDVVRFRTPTVLQMEVVECGAACLAMILGYHGRYVSLENLRYDCGISRDGTKASNIVKAAKSYGLKAKGFRKEPEGLKDLPFPMVVFWNFNHFVVVEGYDEDGFFLNDPATGPRKVAFADFDEAFTGVALAFEPSDDFVPGGKPPSVTAGLRQRLAGSRMAMLLIVVISLGLVVPGLLVPAFTRVYIDYILIEGLSDWLTPLIVAMIGVAILRAGLTWFQQHYLLRLQTKMSLTSSSQFFWHVLRLPIGFFAQRYGGEIGSRIQFNDRVANLVAGDLSVAILNLMTMVIYALIMVQYDAVLTVIGIGFAMMNLLAFVLVSRKLQDAHQRLLLDQGKLTGIAMQGLQMIDNIKASGTDGLFFNRWAGYHSKVVNAEQELTRFRILLMGVPVLLGMIATTSVLVVGGLRVMDGAITIGMLIAFQTLLSNFSAPVNSLVGLGTQFQEAQGYLGRIDDVLRQSQAEEFSDETDDVTIGEKLTGAIDVKNLTFGFIPTNPPLIEDFSLSLKPGQRVALVGGSGSGKSTVGKLLAGLYEPWSGVIELDGKHLGAIHRHVLRTSVAMVDQDIALFEGSISDNITLWDETMPEVRIVQAAKDAMIHNDVNERPEAYNHNVEEMGRNFSGGQRQRIEIARALVGDPAVMILDEATSALDPTTEQMVVDNIRRRGCTCIVIAHRLSTIRDCDEIIVMESGKIVQRGNHETLIAEDGVYKRLIES
ncbi:NHLP family bacteriocin export ABC transporter peptidase/permease/ATPase subunit [Magnetovibrio sp. PR-2]|uniref:NHLP family bacteriocin export ABC transporter peptidase/permease/ATPase subunit n=1 Tax=Magnetovibrio sp. PR-2 TaxID=3120356 RepID=UPI002FCE1587